MLPMIAGASKGVTTSQTYAITTHQAGAQWLWSRRHDWRGRIEQKSPCKIIWPKTKIDTIFVIHPIIRCLLVQT